MVRYTSVYWSSDVTYDMQKLVKPFTEQIQALLRKLGVGPGATVRPMFHWFILLAVSAVLFAVLCGAAVYAYLWARREPAATLTVPAQPLALDPEQVHAVVAAYRARSRDFESFRTATSSYPMPSTNTAREEVSVPDTAAPSGTATSSESYATATTLIF